MRRGRAMWPSLPAHDLAAILGRVRDGKPHQQQQEGGVTFNELIAGLPTSLHQQHASGAAADGGSGGGIAAGGCVERGVVGGGTGEGGSGRGAPSEGGSRGRDSACGGWFVADSGGGASGDEGPGDGGSGGTVVACRGAGVTDGPKCVGTPTSWVARPGGRHIPCWGTPPCRWCRLRDIDGNQPAEDPAEQQVAQDDLCPPLPLAEGTDVDSDYVAGEDSGDRSYTATVEGGYKRKRTMTAAKDAARPRQPKTLSEKMQDLQDADMQELRQPLGEEWVITVSTSSRMNFVVGSFVVFI